MKVLDTDTCIAILRGQERVIERRTREIEEVATTWMTAAELHFGAAKSIDPDGNRALVDEFLATLPVLSPGPASAWVFGEAKALLQRMGTPVADADLIVASIALAEEATVVTRNLRHFARVPGLQVEDWIR